MRPFCAVCRISTAAHLISVNVTTAPVCLVCYLRGLSLAAFVFWLRRLLAK